MFTEEEKLVYKFHDGQRERFIDPLALRRALMRAAGGNLYGLSQAAFGGTPDREEPAQRLEREDARERMVQVIREAFALAPFDTDTGAGVTEAMVLATWTEWVEWREKNAKKGASSPGPSPSTDSPPDAPATT